MSEKQRSGGTGPSLEQKKKRAKELVRAHRAGDPSAARRVIAALPRAAGRSVAVVLAARLRLSEAQFVVARESGFPSWPRMKHAILASAKDRDARIDGVLVAAVDGDRERVRAFLEADPDLARNSLHVACALGDDGAALRLLERDPDSATVSGGTLGWTPLLLVTCARVASRESAPGRVRIASALLDRGADATDRVRDAKLFHGERSALSGAVAIVRDAELARVLIEAGAAQAEHLWHMAILGEATRHDDLECVRLLLPLGPPSWELNGALVELVERDDVEGVRLLLEAGADPNASGVWGRVGTSLHQAILGGASASTLEALLDGKVDVGARDRDGRTALAVAVRTANDAARALLAERTAAEDTGPDALDEMLGACVRGEAVTAGPELVARFRRTDHQMLPWAVRTGRGAAALRLADVGLDVGVADDAGNHALALAVDRGDVALVRELIARGAPVDARDLRGRTALDRALTLEDSPQVRATLVEALLAAGAEAHELRAFPTGDARLDGELRSRGAVERDDAPDVFERAADAVVEGDLATLATLLDESPELARAHSPRPHGATLLHYVAANGLEAHRQRTPPNAPEVLALLLDAGAEPDALCTTYGGGPAQTTLALLVSSDWPAKAGVQGELVERLCAAGANPNGLDEDGVPLATAIAFRCAQAVEALARTARLDNPLFAAAAGRAELVTACIDERGRAREDAGFCRVPWLHMARDPARVAEQTLIVAAQFGHAALVRTLLERGVDANGAPVAERTALHEAAFAGHVDVVELLLTHGADAGKREKQFGSTALGWAQEGKRRDVIEAILARFEPDLFDAVELDLPEHVQRNLERDASHVNGMEGRGGPLLFAASRGLEGVVRVLLAHGADATIASPDGKTALELARDGGHDAVAELLS